MHQLHDFLDTIQPLGLGIHNNLSPITDFDKIPRTMHVRDTSARKHHTMEDRSFTGNIDRDKIPYKITKKGLDYVTTKYHSSSTILTVMPNEPGFDLVAEKAGFLRTYMSGHPDTLVAYAKWFGKVPEAITSAKMTAINTRVRFLFFELSECS